MSSSVSAPLLETGVPNLDLTLGGGILREDVLLVVGQAGTGKTTLSLQILFHAASSGETVLYVSTISEPVTKLLRHIRSYSFYDEQLIGKRVILLSAYPMIRQDLSAVTEALILAVKGAPGDRGGHRWHDVFSRSASRGNRGQNVHL